MPGNYYRVRKRFYYNFKRAMKKEILSCLLCCLLAMGGTNAIANIHPVASLTEFKVALENVKPGDTIVWKDGSYADVKINFQPKQNGIAHNLIVLKAATAGKVIFTGNSQLMLSGQYLMATGFSFEGRSTLDKGDVLAFSNTSSYSRISNCAVIDYSPADPLANNNWMSLQGTFNEVDHCYFSGKTNQGPYLVVRYKTGKDFVDGSDAAPSTHHRIHHNYFGYRTMPTDNGGEDMRIGDSKTSFTRGFNIIEYNYFEDLRLEPEVISNKSCDNIYRFNTFMGNDGALVLRHGQRCFVYGNYFNGKTGRGTSGGIRIINADQTVFNNYLENLEGGKENMKAPITIMSGLVGSALNEYYPASNAIVAYNTVVNSVGAAIKIGAGNKAKGKEPEAPQNVLLAGNLVLNSGGNNQDPLLVLDNKSSYILKDNFYNNGAVNEKGFSMLKNKNITRQNGLSYIQKNEDASLLAGINQRLALHGIQLSAEQITYFDASWKLTKQDVGVSWK